MAVILDAKRISKTYSLGKGNVYQALKSVSLTIEEGEFVSVMGPSGSGKSTLLYCVSGMDRADSGSIAFEGRLIESLSEADAANLRLTKMGFVFQHGNLLKNLSIMDNIVVSAYLCGREKRAGINGRAVELMERVGIGRLKDNDISRVSGGELQRAAICRALINNPAIIFCDEPTGALNSSSTDKILDIFCTINREGCTILLVTHDAKVAAHSDRVLYMMDGQIMGERYLGRCTPNNGDIKAREAGLAEWLSTLGF